MNERVKRALPFAIAGAAILLLLGVRACVVTAPLDRLAPAASAPGDPPGTTARAGVIALPRGGPYQLGFQSLGPARLEVAGKLVSVEPDREPVRARVGVAFARVVLQAGVVPIRFAAPPGARLIWHPPGRRGSLEYVPASSLGASADDLEGAAGTARGDGAIVLAIALVLLALGAWVFRRDLRAADRKLLVAFGACAALALAARAWDLGDAGQTFDEDEYWSSGRNDVQNLLALDAAPDAWVWNYEHPPVTKYLAGAGALWSDGFGPARALSALVMALGCALLVPIGARLYSLRAGVFAAVFAALSPHLVAHGQIVGHEAPTVFLWSLAIWLALRVHDDPERFRSRLAGVGVVLGLAVMTRFVNALLAPVVAAAILAYAPRPQLRRTLITGAWVIAAAAVVTCFVIWPRLWFSPLVHLREALDKTSKLHDPEPFWGELTQTPARWCFAIYVVACTPVLLFAAALAWAPRVRERRAAIVALVWLVAPLGAALSPVRQDGVRYVLPCLTAIALLAGAAIDRIPRPRVAAGVAAALTLYLAVTCVRVAPYYLDYYSEIFGGPSSVAADKRFVISWWGEGMDDAIDYVNDHAAPGARVYRDCAFPNHLTWFRGDLWDPMVRDPASADWIVWTQPSWRACPIPPGAQRVHTTEALGAPLAYVYRVDHPAR
jgi:hypothetical protein